MSFRTAKLLCMTSASIALALTAHALAAQSRTPGFLQAASFPGTECGAKINHAFAATKSVAVDKTCGLLWTTPVTIPVGGSLQITGAGKYIVGSPITLQQSASLQGPAGGMGDGFNNPAVTIRAADKSNLAAVLVMAGSQASVRDVLIDANKLRNPGALDGIRVSAVAHASAQRVEISHVTVSNARRYGYFFLSTGNHNEAAAPKLEQAHSLNAGIAGLACVGTTDGFVHSSEYENGDQDGVSLNSCGGWRFMQDDFGGNARYGLNGEGDYAQWGGGGGIIAIGNQFGNNGRGDIFIHGWDAVHSQHVMTLNLFLGNFHNGLSLAAADNLYDGIDCEDCVANQFGSWTFNQPPDHRYRYGINLTNPHAPPQSNLIGTGAFGEMPAGGGVRDATGKASFDAYVPFLMPNNIPLQWRDASGKPQTVLNLGVNGSVYLTGSPNSSTILFQPRSGATIFQMTPGGSTSFADLAVGLPGHGLKVAEGTDAKQGIAKLRNGIVVVADRAVTTNSRISLTLQDCASCGTLYLSTRVIGESFTVKSTNSADASTVFYEIFEPY